MSAITIVDYHHHYYYYYYYYYYLYYYYYIRFSFFSIEIVVLFVVVCFWCSERALAITIGLATNILSRTV